MGFVCFLLMEFAGSIRDFSGMMMCLFGNNFSMIFSCLLVVMCLSIERSHGIYVSQAVWTTHNFFYPYFRNPLNRKVLTDNQSSLHARTVLGVSNIHRGGAKRRRKVRSSCCLPVQINNCRRDWALVLVKDTGEVNRRLARKFFLCFH